MCGIAGILQFNHQPVTAALVQRMTDVIRHRGPDGDGIYTNGSVGLGHRRLSIIDLSTAGRQPMSNEDGSLWITYNGEIYNFQETRHLLLQKGHQFQSNTDTEVILHAYEEWGFDCLTRFNGMFAFALWDQPRQRLWLARDRLGIKPLFYALCPPTSGQPGPFLFGSEIKALLAGGLLDPKINLTGLHHFLSLNYTPAPHTLFENIFQLLPGTIWFVTQPVSSS
ncbi:MAG: hypothetical protein HC875_30585 [Anaerolineales bacterium]|nr:hypothetical protein [Anaerolineales bacterium]